DINLIGEAMYTYIPSMKGKSAKGTYYKDILAIVRGQLVMGERVSIDEDLSSWISSALGGLTVSEVEASISFANLEVNKVLGTEDEIIAVRNGGDGVVTYSSSNTDVATVNSSNGEISVVGLGTAVITATVEDGDIATYSQKTATYTVTVDTVTVSWAKSNLTSSNISSYMGTKVDYHPTSDTVGVYRIFYLDVDGKYDNAGTLYIKRDYDANLQYQKDANAKTGYNLENFKQFNPSFPSSTESITTSGDTHAAYICSKNMTELNLYNISGVSEYVIGSPSLEMFVDSYNEWKGSEVLSYKYYNASTDTNDIYSASGLYSSAVSGYAVKPNTAYQSTEHWSYYADTNSIEPGPSGKTMYIYGSSNKFWLGSPSCYDTLGVCFINRLWCP
ncbi:MAG: Ig-like domain-containing protein, partial [Clostridia bacterium]|nr:Ig-like domain-containing protein [Clostridia bacterium]